MSIRYPETLEGPWYQRPGAPLRVTGHGHGLRADIANAQINNVAVTVTTVQSYVLSSSTRIICGWFVLQYIC